MSRLSVHDIKTICRSLTESTAFVKKKENESTSTKTHFLVLENEIKKWSDQYKTAIGAFLTELFNEASLSAENKELPLPEWFKEARLSHRNARRSRSPPEFIHLAYHNPFTNSDVHLEDRTNRLLWMFETIDINFLRGGALGEIVNSYFNAFFDTSERAALFQLGGRFSELDSLSQDERIELSKAFIAPENVDSTIYVDSCMMISIEMLRTRCLVNVEDPSTVIGDIQQEFEQLKLQLGRGSRGSSSQQILERLTELSWGPQQYEREQEIIDDAKRVLQQNGAMSITAWGGAGKTALANKLTYDFAVNAEFDRFVVFTTKLDSSQGELRFKDGLGATHIQTSTATTIHDNMRNSDGRLQGGFRRVCLQIIRASGIDHASDIQDYETPQLHELALKALQKQKILLVLDNFEDIEKPDEEDLDRSAGMVDLIDTEYGWFSQFVSDHCENKSKGKTQSCVIITTRGEPKLGAKFPLEMLNSDENLALFKRVVLHRIKETKTLDPHVHQLITQNLRLDVENAFSKWRGVSTISGKKSGIHPFNTQGAAWTVRSEHNIISAIDSWNPKNNQGDPRKVAQYCTSRMIENNPDAEERDVLETSTSLGMNKSFTHEDFMNIAKSIEVDWDLERVSAFVRKYWRERLWLEKHPSKSEFRWTYNIHLHLRAASAKAPGKRKTKQQNQPMTIDLSNRLELYNFLEKPDEKKLAKIKRALIGLLTEENVDSIHNEHLMMALLDVKLQSQIPSESWPQHTFPQQSFLEIMIDYLHKARKSNHTFQSKDATGSARNSEKNFKITEKGKFVREIWDSYSALIFKLIDNEHVGVNEVRIIARSCSTLAQSNVINEKIFLNFLHACLKKCLVIHQSGNISDSERFDMEILHDLLPRVFEIFRPWRWAPGSNTEECDLDLCKTILRAYDLRWEDRNHSDRLQANVFWTIMAYYLEQRDAQPTLTVEHAHIALLLRFEDHGLALANRWYEPGVAMRTYYQTLLNSGGFDILDLGHFANERENYDLSEDTHIFARGTREVVHRHPEIFVLVDELGIMPRGTLKTQIYFRITNFTGSRLYLRPVLDENGRPIQPLLSPPEIGDSEQPLDLIPHVLQAPQQRSDETSSDVNTELLKSLLLAQKENPTTWKQFKDACRSVGIVHRRLMRDYVRPLGSEMNYIILNDRLATNGWLNWLVESV